MNGRKKVILLGLYALVTACGSSDEPGPGDTDASGPDVESGAETTAPCLAPSALGTVGRSRDGVWTNHPALFHFTKTGGNLDIITAYFELDTFTDFNSLVAWGDVQNNTNTQQCAPYVDEFSVGMLGAITVIDGPAYELPGSQVSYICLEPGARAIFRTIQNNVPATALDGEVTISYSFTGIPFAPPNRRHPDDPQIVSVSPKQDPLGWRVSGQMRAGPGSIHTLQVRVYIRDPNGLLYKDFELKPGGGHTIVAGSLFDFETDPNRGEFCSYEIFNRFIDGPEAQVSDGGVE